MTSLNLLKNADTTNQNFVAIFHLDGTYRITLNNFPLSVFGRSDMNRKFFPIALALLSRETADDILAFLLADCDYLHSSTNLAVFEERKFEVLSNWSAVVWKKEVFVALQKFKKYFIEQWLQGSFTNWQIFNTPPGYATTQNPEESFNKQIKY